MSASSHKEAAEHLKEILSKDPGNRPSFSLFDGALLLPSSHRAKPFQGLLDHVGINSKTLAVDIFGHQFASTPAGGVIHVDGEMGKIARHWPSRGEWIADVTGPNSDRLVGWSVLTQWATANRHFPGPQYRFSPRMPFAIGGQITLDNIELVGFETLAARHRQVFDLVNRVPVGKMVTWIGYNPNFPAGENEPMRRNRVKRKGDKDEHS